MQSRVLIAAVTDAANSDTFEVTYETPVSLIFTGTLTATKDVTFEMRNDAKDAWLPVVSATVQLTSVENTVLITGIGTYRAVKAATTNANGVEMFWS